MKFLRQLISWFFHGTAKAENPVETLPPRMEEENEKKVLNTAEQSLADILDQIRSYDFLGELRAISSVSPEIHRARQELVHEIKNLALRRAATHRKKG